MNLDSFKYRHPAGRWIMPLIVAVATIIFGLTAQAATITVSVQDYEFDPQFIAINVGDTVLWHNKEGGHTVTSDDGLFFYDSSEVGEESTYTFDEVGVYGYHCSIHGGVGNGMYGTIIVSEAAGNSPPFTPVNLSPADGATNQPVALQLHASVFSDPDSIDFHGASEWVINYDSDGSVALDSGPVSGSGNMTNYSPFGLSEGTSYNWQVRYKDGRGAWSQYSTPTHFTTLVSFGEVGIGLRASYSNIPDFASPRSVVTNAIITFDWGKRRPEQHITADDFAVRWEGSLLPQFTETYQIQFQFRGQARVWVNNQLLIDEWNGCAFTQTRRGSIPLVAGQLVSVRIDYIANPANAQAILRWISPSQLMEVIPTSQLFPQAP